MNISTIGLGALLCILSLFLQYRRLTDRSKQKQLMQKFMGRKVGSFGHLVSCVVFPGIAGLILIYFGMNGRSFTDLLYVVNVLVVEENFALLF